MSICVVPFVFVYIYCSFFVLFPLCEYVWGGGRIGLGFTCTLMRQVNTAGHFSVIEGK